MCRDRLAIFFSNEWAWEILLYLLLCVCSFFCSFLISISLYLRWKNIRRYFDALYIFKETDLNIRISRKIQTVKLTDSQYLWRSKGQKISKKKLLSWILPKNKRWGNFMRYPFYVLIIAPASVFWKNPGRHNLLLRFTDL